MDEFSLLKSVIHLKGLNDNVFYIKINGISMEPLFYSDDIAIVKHAEYYNPGDIIIFIYNNHIYIHRILKISENNVITKGDHSVNAEYTKKDGILGKVVGIKLNDSRSEIYFNTNYKKERVISYLSLRVNRRYKATKDWAFSTQSWSYRLIQKMDIQTRESWKNYAKGAIQGV